ncbi:hypothetical protein [Hymenobacter arizonensis]|uniref:Uncharacterized protein n=1 Tax=Hymenobacter arizonensis TaxID=1227077 RepID=A0A1I5WUT1_HYMAR|nr:hypothetical protein [Hymenobacter arizonensis]SFQ23565.1 hypothetical protein SAMN04515668_1505 [Hymenobacter arizonensis]
MCEACFVKGIHRFSSADVFAKFEQQLLGTNLQAQGRPAYWPVPAPLTAFEPEAFYRCGTCHQIWALAAPDNAWRGYFLPLEAVRAHQRQRQRSDARIKYYVLAMVTAVLWLILTPLAKVDVTQLSTAFFPNQQKVTAHPLAQVGRWRNS